jgi:hypothetical protein
MIKYLKVLLFKAAINVFYELPLSLKLSLSLALSLSFSTVGSLGSLSHNSNICEIALDNASSLYLE